MHLTDNFFFQWYKKTSRWLTTWNILIQTAPSKLYPFWFCLLVNFFILFRFVYIFNKKIFFIVHFFNAKIGMWLLLKFLFKTKTLKRYNEKRKKDEKENSFRSHFFKKTEIFSLLASCDVCYVFELMFIVIGWSQVCWHVIWHIIQWSNISKEIRNCVDLVIVSNGEFFINGTHENTRENGLCT